MTHEFYMWLGSEAEAAACELETLEQLKRELLPVIEEGDDG
jgi:hypothetical protein